MKIHELRPKNFRKFEDSVFRFNADSRVTVLIGDNATGKTAILDALSIMMGCYLQDFKTVTARHIRKNEIRLKRVALGGTITLEPQWKEGVAVACTASLDELIDSQSSTPGTLSWSKELNSRSGRNIRKNANNIAGFGGEASGRVEKGEPVLLPVLGYYGTGRLWHQKQDTTLSEPDSRTVGYRLSQVK